jgi:hypothetical protein
VACTPIMQQRKSQQGSTLVIPEAHASLLSVAPVVAAGFQRPRTFASPAGASSVFSAVTGTPTVSAGNLRTTAISDKGRSLLPVVAWAPIVAEPVRRVVPLPVVAPASTRPQAAQHTSDPVRTAPFVPTSVPHVYCAATEPVPMPVPVASPSASELAAPASEPRVVMSYRHVPLAGQTLSAYSGFDDSGSLCFMAASLSMLLPLFSDNVDRIARPHGELELMFASVLTLPRSVVSRSTIENFMASSCAANAPVDSFDKKFPKHIVNGVSLYRHQSIADVLQWLLSLPEMRPFANLYEVCTLATLICMWFRCSYMCTVLMCSSLSVTLCVTCLTCLVAARLQMLQCPKLAGACSCVPLEQSLPHSIAPHPDVRLKTLKLTSLALQPGDAGDVDARHVADLIHACCIGPPLRHAMLGPNPPILYCIYRFDDAARRRQWAAGGQGLTRVDVSACVYWIAMHRRCRMIVLMLHREAAHHVLTGHNSL